MAFSAGYMDRLADEPRRRRPENRGGSGNSPLTEVDGAVEEDTGADGSADTMGAVS